MNDSWIFGIDGGGTSARLRIEAVSGGLLFFGEGGSSNPRSNPRENVLANLRALFERAYREAALTPDGCRAGFAGTAGVDRAADRRPFADLMREAALLPINARLEASNDAEPALVGALGDTEGILLIAGTGSIAFGRTRSGTSVRSGGWGHLLGDEGSAFAIAFEALKRGLRAHEGRDISSSLLDDALAYFQLAEPSDLVPFIYEGLDKTRIAKFARIVCARRDSGDKLASAILDEAEAALESLVRSVYARIGAELSRKRIAFRGGLIEGDRQLREGLVRRLAVSLPELAVVEPVADAASGACILARELLAG